MTRVLEDASNICETQEPKWLEAFMTKLCETQKSVLIIREMTPNCHMFIKASLQTLKAKENQIMIGIMKAASKTSVKKHKRITRKLQWTEAFMIKACKKKAQ